MKKRILIIDDDTSILSALKMIFEEEDYMVDASTDGSPLGEINGYAPDLVLVDLMLQGEDGRDLVKNLKSKRGSIPVIMYSAMSDAESSALSSGADYFLAKPFDLNRLIDVADKLIKKS